MLLLLLLLLEVLLLLLRHAGQWPLAAKVSPKLSNNHLSYALTWFGMALGLIAVYIVLVLKERKARAS